LIGKENIIGRNIGNYVIVAEIASGSFGQVYRAQHTYLTKRLVAIKFLHSTYLDSLQERERFLQEAQFLEILKHPHILPIIDVGIDVGTPYIVSEYATNGSLRDLLMARAGQPLELEEGIKNLSQVGEALHYAHEQQVIHRDLKPENILFNAHGDALLADFGIATMAATASVKLSGLSGTPSYMSPEQFRGTIGKRSDQYALACITYELFTGYKPFSAPDFFAIGMKHISEEPIKPSHLNSQISSRLEKVILKGMSKLRTDRYPDVKSFIDAFGLLETAEIAVPSLVSKDSRQWLTVARKRYAEKNYAEALLACEQVILLDGRSVAALKLKCEILAELGRREEVLAVCEQVIKLDPQNASLYCLKGENLLSLKAYSAALTAYSAALTYDPGYAEACYGRGQALRGLKRNAEALLAYDEAIRLASHNAHYYCAKGHALSDLGQYEPALAAYEQALKLDSQSSDAFSGKGNVLGMLGQYAEAAIAYEQAIHFDVKNISAYIGKGFVLCGLERYSAALEAYEQAIQLDPASSYAYEGKRFALEYAGRARAGQTLYKQIL
jgi:tetratricopeptide (TPR) repeat protein/tRNA A-37 threonylcarbamoyl transferase component Bud32